MLAIWRNGNKEKKQCCHFPQAFQRQAFSTAINIRYRECCAHSFPFYLCLFFFSRSFWTNPVGRDLIATIRAQEKSLSGVKKSQPPKGPAKSQLDR